MSYEHWVIDRICNEFEQHGRVLQAPSNMPEIASRVHAIINKLAEENRQLKEALAMHERAGPQGTLG